MDRQRLERVAAASPLQWSFERAARRRVAVLAYHDVPAEHATTFEAQMQWLVEHRTPLDATTALDVLDGGHAPPGAVLVTFDDGDPTVASVAAPILDRLGIGAYAFVNPAVIGTDEPQWWDEATHLVEAGGRCDAADGPAATVVASLKLVPDDERRRALDQLRDTAATPAPRRVQLAPTDLADLTAQGIAIGNHGLTHALLDRCDDTTLRAELLDAHGRLGAWLGREPIAFAYPNGNVDRRAVAILAGAGYRVAFTFDHHLTDGPAADRWAVSRLRVNAWTPLERLRLILSGLHPTYLRLRRRPR